MHSLQLASFKWSSNLSRNLILGLNLACLELVYVHTCSLESTIWLSIKCQYSHFFGATAFISLGMWRAVDQHKNNLFCFQRVASISCNSLMKNERLLLWKGEWEGGNVLICILCCYFIEVFSSPSSCFCHIYCLPLYLFTCQWKILISCWPVSYLFAWFARLFQYALTHLRKIAFSLKFKMFVSRFSNGSFYSRNSISNSINK